MLEYLADFLLGLGIGLIAGLFGVGGGFLIVPALTILGLPIHVAIGTSLACIVLSSLSAAVTHIRRGTVLYRVVAIKEVFSVPAALMGAYASSLLPEDALKAIFILLLLYLSFKMWRDETAADLGGGELKTLRISAVGILSGLISGLLGISGGILNVPLFHAYVRIPMKYAVGTSSLALFFTALAASFGHYRLGQVDLHTALLLAPGLLVGARIGALLVHRAHPRHLRKAFSVILVAVALRMLL